jgi:lysophospholipid acyltransferase (LPLAT)-like uncharacterized protein
MKLRHPGLIKLVAFLAAWVVRVWMSSVRFRLYFQGGGRHPADSRKQAYIYAFWHEALLFPTAFKARIHVLVSQHADGELIARTMKHLGYGVVRGSTTRGGTAALLELAQLPRNAHLGITPDGPRGPRRKLQMGVIYLAALTGLPVIPIGATADRAWRAKSWDRMVIPKPWSTAYAVTAAPIRVPKSLDRQQLEPYRLQLEEAMLRATLAAERWAHEGIHPSRAGLDKQDSLANCA